MFAHKGDIVIAIAVIVLLIGTATGSRAVQK